jgi:hypothetical protein
VFLEGQQEVERDAILWLHPDVSAYLVWELERLSRPTGRIKHVYKMEEKTYFDNHNVDSGWVNKRTVEPVPRSCRFLIWLEADETKSTGSAILLEWNFHICDGTSGWAFLLKVLSEAIWR